LFGTGRALAVHWEKQIPPYTKLDVTYKEPWVLGTQSTLLLSIYHLLEDTLYTFSKANLTVKTDLSLNISLGLIVGWEKFSPAATDIPESRKYFIGSQLEFTNLDYATNPRKGIDYTFYTEYGKKTSVSVTKLTANLFNSLPVFSNNAITILFSGMTSRTNTPPLAEYEQFTLGGYNSLRGYRDRQFRATQILRVSPEYRYLVSKKSRLYLFYDCAYFKTCDYTTSLSRDHYKDGYGVGARISAAIGIISLEFAVGEQKSLMKSKIHLGIDTTF